MKYGVAINPKAGHNTKKRDSICATTQKYFGITDEAIVGAKTRSTEEFCACIERLAQGTNTIISLGGDGTLRDVINTLRKHDHLDTHVIIPIMIGTGNAFSYVSKQPKNAQALPEWLANRRTHRLDLIVENETAGFMSSIGYDAEVLIRREEQLRCGRGPITSYALAGLKEYHSSKPFSGEISIKGKRYSLKECRAVIVSTSPYFGKGMKMFPNQDMLCDGEMHARIIEGGSNKVLQTYAQSFLGGAKAGYVLRGEEISIHLNRNVKQQIEGDVTRSDKEFNYRIEPRSAQLQY